MFFVQTFEFHGIACCVTHCTFGTVVSGAEPQAFTEAKMEAKPVGRDANSSENARLTKSQVIPNDY